MWLHLNKTLFKQVLAWIWSVPQLQFLSTVSAESYVLEILKKFTSQAPIGNLPFLYTIQNVSSYFHSTPISCGVEWMLMFGASTYTVGFQPLALADGCRPDLYLETCAHKRTCASQDLLLMTIFW